MHRAGGQRQGGVLAHSVASNPRASEVALQGLGAEAMGIKWLIASSLCPCPCKPPRGLATLSTHVLMGKQGSADNGESREQRSAAKTTVN